jgi:hypothetical protein
MKKPSKPTFIPSVAPATPSLPTSASLADASKAGHTDPYRKKTYQSVHAMPYQSRRNNRKKG